MNIKKALISGMVIGGLVIASAFPVLAEDNADNGEAHLMHVGLNPAACTGPFTGPDSGEVNVHNNVKKDTTKVNVEVEHALPNQTYVVDVRCVGQIGTLTTNSEGEGNAHINMPGNLTGTVYVDISVAGGGGGAGGYGDTFIAGPFTF